MAISTSGEFIQKIEGSLGASAAFLSVENFEFAATQALSELGWSYPIDKPKQEYWSIQRGKRHALDILRVQSAHRFQFKQLSLQHRFRHYNELIQQMDQDFQKALDSGDPDLMSVSPEGMFGLSVGNGFVYDQYGNDVSRILHDLGIDNEGYRHTYMPY